LKGQDHITNNAS